MKKYNIVFFGVKNTTEEIIRWVIKSGYKIDLLITLNPETAGKYHISGYKDLRPMAEELQIEYHFLEDYSVNGEADKKFFLENNFNMGISYGWQRLVPGYVLDRFTQGIFGFHGSAEFLPKGKGRSPLNWSLIEDRKIFHNHLFKYDKTPDGGSIFDISDFEINSFDNIFRLQYKVILVAQEQLKKLFKASRDGIINLKEQVGSSTFYPKRKPEDGKIDFLKSTVEIYNLIRAVTHPFPGAFCFKGDKKIIVWEAYPFDKIIDFSDYRIGQVIEVINDQPVIKTKDGSIIFINYEFEEKLNKGDLLI